MSALDIPPVVRAVADGAAAVGGRTFLVGGSVRDHHMGKPIKDWDLEVHGVEADVLERQLRKLGRVDTVGKSFAVFKLHLRGLELDVSIPRRDSKAGPGHKGIVAEGDPHLGVVEATRRRDLTVNALLMDVITGEVLDPWHGLDDLRDRVLRPVDRETFLEDPLRAVRAVQFAARLEFTPSESLKEQCREAALDELPPERVLGEWAKLLLRGGRPSLGMALARDTNILARLFPQHPCPVVQDAALDRATASRPHMGPEGRALALMVAVWLAGLPGPDAVATLDRLKLFRWVGFPTREVALAAASQVDAPIATDADLRWLSTRAEVELTLFARAALRDEDLTPVMARAAALGVLWEKPQAWVAGRDLEALGMRPGREMGALLQALYAAQLDGALTSPEEAQALAKQKLGL